MQDSNFISDQIKYKRMLTIQRFEYSNQDLMRMAHAIRTEVFVGEQGIDPALEYDVYDRTARHYLCFMNEQPVGTGRWRETEKGFKLERFAVPASHRNAGIGAALLQAMLDDLLPLKKPVYLHAQNTAVHFYEKHHFVKEGNVFYEAGIAHYRMYLPVE